MLITPLKSNLVILYLLRFVSNKQLIINNFTDAQRFEMK